MHGRLGEEGGWQCELRGRSVGERKLSLHLPQGKVGGHERVVGGGGGGGPGGDEERPVIHLYCSHYIHLTHFEERSPAEGKTGIPFFFLFT